MLLSILFFIWKKSISHKMKVFYFTFADGMKFYVEENDTMMASHYTCIATL